LLCSCAESAEILRDTAARYEKKALTLDLADRVVIRAGQDAEKVLKLANERSGFKLGSSVVQASLFVLDPPWNCLPKTSQPHDALADDRLKKIFKACLGKCSADDVRLYAMCKFQDIGKYSVFLEEAGWTVWRVPFLFLQSSPHAGQVRVFDDPSSKL
jgi:hypothetical protein